MTTSAPRLVLDTNVCLDLFVFGDAMVAELHALLRARELVAITDAACRDEWLRVLGYPQFALDAQQQTAAAQAFDVLLQLLPEHERAEPTVVLPRCADEDDQKFLELAHACGAAWLLSKDNEVLRLARRAENDAGFRIATPTAWRAQWLSEGRRVGG